MREQEPGTPEDRRRVEALEDLGVPYSTPEERFDRITRFARRLFDVETAAVTLVDADTQHVKSSAGLTLAEIPREEAFCNRTIATAHTLVVPDASEDAQFAANSHVMGDRRVRFYAGHPLEAPGGHRVGALCLIDGRPRSFGQGERSLLTQLAWWVQHELTRSKELEHAGEVQRRLLPRTRPDLPGFDIDGACLPARAVGGDFFDWHPTDDGGLAVTLCDVKGQGLSAAIMMATVRAVLRSTSGIPSPAEAVGRAASILAEDLEETGTLVTLCHARLRPDSNVIHYADAGHGLLLRLRPDGTITRPPGDGLPLGVAADATWQERESHLEPGDLVLAVSDGLLDLGRRPLESALGQLAAAVRHVTDAREAVERLLGLVGSPRDDVTVVVVRRHA